VVFCKKAWAGGGPRAPLGGRLRDAHPGQVREVWKAFVPMYLSVGPESYSAELGIAAAEQGRFWELHDLAFAGHGARGRPSRGELEALAVDARLDTARALREERAGQLRAAVERDVADGRRLGVVHAPGLLVNGILFTTPPTWERLEKLAREELQRGVYDRLTAP
jgi:protein-disulfide isomerase